MSIPQNTAYFYLNSSNELVMKVQWVDPPTTIIYVRPDGSAAPAGNYPPADDAVSFTLYADGSLESYRNLGGDGSFTWLKFAQAAPGQGKPFGTNSEYSHGDLIFSETLTPDEVNGTHVLVHKVQSFANGNLTNYEFSYGTPDNSSVVLAGTYDSVSGNSTVSLTNRDHPTPIVNTGPGLINNLNGLSASLISDNGAVLIGNDGSTLVGTDGASLIGNDGGTFNQRNVSSLVGTDGASLIGNDGGTLINFNGGGNSIISPSYKLSNGQLIGNDGSTLVGTDGASLAANAMASFRGYSAYTLSSFDTGEQPSVDTLTADTTTTGRLDLFGELEGELETAGDRDWVKVELKAGETYVITANGAASGDGTLTDPHVKLLDATGTLVAEDGDSGVGNNAKLVYTATKDGTFYVEASSEGDTGVGTYEIGVHIQPTAFVKDGASIDMGHGGFPSETSIVALSDGGFAIGFTTRYDGQQPDGAQNYVAHANVAIIDAAGQWVDLDSRADYSTYYMPRPGDGNAHQPGSAQLTAGEDGGFSMIVANTWSFPYASSTEAQVAHGSVLGLGPGNSITSLDGSGSYGGFPNNSSYAVDIARLANGQYVASLAGGASYKEPDGSYNPNVIQVSINGALPLTIADSGALVGGSYNPGQQTSVSALGSGAVVVWTDAAADSSGDQNAGEGVLGAILDENGNVLHTFDVNQTEARLQWVDSAQAVTELADGGFVVAWAGYEDVSLHEGYAWPYFPEVYVRVFNADGSPRGDEILLAGSADGVDGYHPRPSVIGLPGGGFAVSWLGKGAGGNIRLQQFDGNGNEIGAETGVGNGGGQSMTLAPDGNLAIAYMGDGLLRVQVMEPNHAPTDISLSANMIKEDVGNGSYVLIGNVSAVDQNVSDTFTYQLIDSANGQFRLDGTELRWNGYNAPDFETQSSYEIKVKVTDSAETSITKTLTVNVTDVNEPVIGLKGNYYALVSENAAVGTVVATLAGDDPDKNETFTYEIVDAANTPFEIVGNQIRVKGLLDAEELASYNLTLRIKDSANHTVNKNFTIGVDNLDDTAPTSITLYSNRVEENAAPGTSVGVVYASDPDTFTDLTYELVGPNADLFELKQQFGSWLLVTKGTLDHETMPTVDVTIRASDPGNRSLEQTFTLTVDDVNDLPVITSASAFSVKEGTDRIVKLAATDADGDAITWTLAPSSQADFADVFAFLIDSEGYLQLDPGVEADNPWDADGDGVYHFEVSAYDGTDESTQEITVTVVGGNADPIIDGGLNTFVKLKENKALVKTIDATDPDGDSLDYSIVGGPDSELFTIKTVNGKAQLVFKDAPDFENPGDVGSNNSYNVIIRADDGNGGVADQAVAIEVQNVKGISFPGTKGVDVKNGTDEEDILSGADKNDTLDGKGGNDVLNGGLGKDKLIGGTGEDIFVFDTKPAKDNADIIVKFSVADDQFHLDNAAFAKIGKEGFLSKNSFFADDNGEAADKFDRIIYNKDSGELFYDADGSKNKADAILFATLDKRLDLSFSDFEIV